jgi:hypothetical protein
MEWLLPVAAHFIGRSIPFPFLVIQMFTEQPYAQDREWQKCQGKGSFKLWHQNHKTIDSAISTSSLRSVSEEI